MMAPTGMPVTAAIFLALFRPHSPFSARSTVDWPTPASSANASWLNPLARRHDSKTLMPRTITRFLGKVKG